MKYFRVGFLLLLIFAFLSSIVYSQHNITNYGSQAQEIIDHALSNEQAFDRLTTFVDTYPHRLSGSEMLEESIDWILATMQKNANLDSIYTQTVMVPHWVRGQESATLTAPYSLNLPMLGLGGSIATAESGIEAEVLVVKSFDDLRNKGEKAKGKIIVYNVPFTTYGETVQYRMEGAIAAARQGAVASLIRSVAPYSMKTPHTGTSNYDENIKKIPHAAITLEHAMLLQRMQDRGIQPQINLKMDAQTLPDKESRNIIAEIKGSQYPEEIVVIGGHIDAWDVGQGAMDDAGGCFAAWEALRLLKKLGYQPKRTIRLVMWTNEENGLRGATEYRDMVIENGEIGNHVLAIESDSGVFDPQGFGFSGTDEAFEIIQEIGMLLRPINAENITRGGGGADIGPIMQEGVPGMGLRVDSSRYFWYHHSAADTIDKLTPEEYNECIAALAVMAYVAADMDTALPS